MITDVSLLRYASKKFTYAVPDHLCDAITVGSLVYVPLQNRMVVGVVQSVRAQDTVKRHYELKYIDSIFRLPRDERYETFLKKVAYFYQIDYLVLLKRLEFFLLQADHDVVPSPYVQTIAVSVVRFTKEQEIAYNVIKKSLITDEKKTFLLQGVTGSGKTELYKQLILDAVSINKSVIIMLPEVSLALRFEQIFKLALQGVDVYSFHSATTASVKKQLWQNLLEEKPVVVIGVHLPILLPVVRLGLVIIDEEHDAGYEEKQFPFLNSKDMALMKADIAGAVTVLGSATPSVVSLHNAEHKGWPVLKLAQRYAGSFPQIKIVSLKDSFIETKSWFSKLLVDAIGDRLERKEQVIIFLNRRGYSFFVQCTCGTVFSCRSCSVSLTLHQDQTLRCHYCAHVEQIPERCYSCNLHADTFIKKGLGTQQVVEQLKRMFPQARIDRADLDTTSKKRSWANTVADMLDGSIDILVGTQSITKGYHFPKVTLVGIIWADLNVHFPMYNATEVALQQLIQVAGRAGRQSHDSLVVVQAFDHHPIFDFLDEHRYPLFVEQERQKRALFGYPPVGHIAHISLQHVDEVLLWDNARSMVTMMEQIITQKFSGVSVLGPSQSLLYKLKGQFNVIIMLKAEKRTDLIQVYRYAFDAARHASVSFLIDPIS